MGPELALIFKVWQFFELIKVSYKDFCISQVRPLKMHVVWQKIVEPRWFAGLFVSLESGRWHFGVMFFVFNRIVRPISFGGISFYFKQIHAQTMSNLSHRYWRHIFLVHGGFLIRIFYQNLGIAHWVAIRLKWTFGRWLSLNQLEAFKNLSLLADIASSTSPRVESFVRFAVIFLR